MGEGPAATRNRPEEGRCHAPKRDAAPPNPPLGDRPIMAIGIPAFGLAIPLLTGLYGTLTPDRSGVLGSAAVCFLALAAAIWLGNRWLLLQQRRHLDWFEQPARKLMMLVAANVLYTAPLTLAWISAWYLLRGLPVDVAALQVVTLTNVICVVFVTHAYETVFLIRERESDMMRVERLERMRVEGELAALTSQIDPHFLFNSLNTLGHVIAPRPGAGARLLRPAGRGLPLRARQPRPAAGVAAGGAGLRRQLLRPARPALRPGDRAGGRAGREAAADAGSRIPPLALQTLLENAVKHNRFDPAFPLGMRAVAARRRGPLRPREAAAQQHPARRRRRPRQPRRALPPAHRPRPRHRARRRPSSR